MIFNLYMLNLKYLFLIFLLSWISHCGFPSCKKTDYTFHTFTLTWVSQFCSMKNRHCNDQKEPFVEGGQRPLSIHGFWPSSLDLAYLDCLIKNKKDFFCYTKFPFNKDLFSREEIDLLQKYWPDLQDNKFWKYEWDKHGTCYLNIIKEQRRSPLSPERIFKDYFMGIIEKAQKLNIRLPAATSIPTKEDLAYLINLDSSQFYAICDGKHSLSQLRVCYDINSQPKKEKIRSCPISEDKKLCVFPISLRD